MSRLYAMSRDHRLPIAETGRSFQAEYFPLDRIEESIDILQVVQNDLSEKEPLHEASEGGVEKTKREEEFFSFTDFVGGVDVGKINRDDVVNDFQR